LTERLSSRAIALRTESSWFEPLEITHLAARPSTLAPAGAVAVRVFVGKSWSFHDDERRGRRVAVARRLEDHSVAVRAMRHRTA
jgi:hypothetical protein